MIGDSGGRTTGSDYATVAYSAATGRQLWARRYNGPANGYDDAFSVAVSPGGTRVFVTGNSGGRATSQDYATVAYDAATGRQLWVSRYNDPANLDLVCGVAVSPGGSRVFVTGKCYCCSESSPGGPSTLNLESRAAESCPSGRPMKGRAHTPARIVSRRSRQ